MSSEAPSQVCVFCRRAPVDPVWRPFCSERCKMQDLGRWAGGDYRIPGKPVDDTSPEADEIDQDRNGKKSY